MAKKGSGMVRGRSAGSTVQRAREALTLGNSHKGVLEDRWPPGLLDGTAVKVQLLSDNLPGQIDRLTRQKAGTTAVQLAGQRGADETSALRFALARGKLDAAILKEAGSGTRVNPRVSTQVLAAIDAMSGAAAAHPAEFTAAGVLPKDVEAIGRRRGQVSEAKGEQVERKVGRKLGTRERNRLQVEIEEAIDRISAAGVVHYTLHDPRPDLAAAFRALVEHAPRIASDEPETPSEPAAPAVPDAGTP
jgi:hypothetical protein